jgi:protein-S-isoprenylcysteine O-methyltransferase Ste14
MLRWVPSLFVVLLVGVGFVWRAWLQGRRFGHSGVHLFASGRRSQHVRESALVGLVILLVIQAVWAAVQSPMLSRLQLPLTGGAAAGWFGCAVAFAGLAIMVRAQLDMGASWRVGFDEAARPGLVTRGLYRCSRNPIYLGLFIGLFGMLLVVPTWLSLALLVGAVLGVGRQVREEEVFLTRAYGGEYRAYAARVGRFVPGLGLLRGA